MSQVDEIARSISSALAIAQDALEQARVQFGELQQALKHRAAPVGPARPPTARGKRHQIGDERLTILELAHRAGCTVKAMRLRLGRGMTTAEAVAAGARMDTGAAAHAAQFKYRWKGELVSAAFLADLAGCSKTAMSQRLCTLQMTPEEAVARGPNVHHSRLAGDQQPATVPAPTVIPLAPVTPRPGFGEQMHREALRSSTSHKAKAPPAPPAFAKDTPVILPEGVKVTVAPTPRDRFSVDPAEVPSSFSSMRPGQYLDNDNALARAYRGK